MRMISYALAFLALLTALRAQDFTRTLTPEERASAGLDRLTPEELARLKALVERYKSGEVTVVREQAERTVAETAAKARAAEQKAAATEARVQEAEHKAVVAEEKAKAAETRAAAAPEPKKKGPGWLTALITLEKTNKDPKSAEAIESRLAGPFKGWRRNTVFDLENGQRWQATDDNDYVTPPMPAPKVKVYPGLFGSFWMEFDGVTPRARVKPLKLE
jgi:hypothetical protein